MSTYPLCECCGRELRNAAAVVALELDQRTETYHNLGGVPANESQGWFDFGSSCAVKKLREHRSAVRGVRAVRALTP